jgi:heme/copper-type cytochrome/quinol oxidase subunit 2
MKTSIENCPKNVVKTNFKYYWLSLATVLFFAATGLAETTLTPSEEAAQLAKNLEHQTSMSYIYMVVGFVVIIGVAWLSVVKSKGNGSNESSEHHHTNHHHHHNIHDKRYGTNKAR